MYDALNVLSAMEIISKYKNQIYYNEDNEFIDDDVKPSTKPDKVTMLELDQIDPKLKENHKKLTAFNIMQSKRQN